MLKDTHMGSHMHAHTDVHQTGRPSALLLTIYFLCSWLPKAPGMAKKNKMARRKIAQGLEGSTAPAERKRTVSVVR